MYMVKSNLSILNRIGINGINENNGIFVNTKQMHKHNVIFNKMVNTKQMHKHNVIFNKMVTKIATILKPTSYLNRI